MAPLSCVMIHSGRTICSYSQCFSWTLAFFRTCCYLRIVIWPNFRDEWMIIIRTFTRTCKCPWISFYWHKWNVPEPVQSFKVLMNVDCNTCRYLVSHVFQYGLSLFVRVIDHGFFPSMGILVWGLAMQVYLLAIMVVYLNQYTRVCLFQVLAKNFKYSLLGITITA